MKPVRKTIVVLGVHRSGTSLTAGVLKSLGVMMGEVLLEKGFGNPVGHFEDSEILHLNNTIIQSAGGEWDKPPAPEEITAQKDIFFDRIKGIVETKNSAALVWGWKDPRTCLTIDLFLEHLTNPYVIVCRRSNDEIAKSLQLRNNIPYKDGITLAESYEERISRFMEKQSELPCLFLNHRDNLANPDKMIGSLIEFIGIDPDKTQISSARNLFQSKQKIWIMRILLLLKKMFVEPRAFIKKMKQRFHH